MLRSALDSEVNKKPGRVAILFIVSSLLASRIAEAQRTDAYRPFESQTNYYAQLHVMRGFVNRYGRKSLQSHIVAKADSGDGTTALYGYWPEDHSILVLDHFNPVFENGKELTDYEWLKYKARIDLRTDLVPTEENVGWKLLFG